MGKTWLVVNEVWKNWNASFIKEAPLLSPGVVWHVGIELDIDDDCSGLALKCENIYVSKNGDTLLFFYNESNTKIDDIDDAIEFYTQEGWQLRSSRRDDTTPPAS